MSGQSDAVAHESVATTRRGSAQRNKLHVAILGEPRVSFGLFELLSVIGRTPNITPNFSVIDVPEKKDFKEFKFINARKDPKEVYECKMSVACSLEDIIISDSFWAETSNLKEGVVIFVVNKKDTMNVSSMKMQISSYLNKWSSFACPLTLLLQTSVPLGKEQDSKAESLKTALTQVAGQLKPAASEIMDHAKHSAGDLKDEINKLGKSTGGKVMMQPTVVEVMEKVKLGTSKVEEVVRPVTSTIAKKCEPALKTLVEAQSPVSKIATDAKQLSTEIATDVKQKATIFTGKIKQIATELVPEPLKKKLERDAEEWADFMARLNLSNEEHSFLQHWKTVNCGEMSQQDLKKFLDLFLTTITSDTLSTN